MWNNKSLFKSKISEESLRILKDQNTTKSPYKQAYYLSKHKTYTGVRLALHSYLTPLNQKPVCYQRVTLTAYYTDFKNK